MLDTGRDTGAERMAAALRALPHQPKPSDVRIPGLLDGLEVIGDFVHRWLDRPAASARRLTLMHEAR
jgi:hypothetical protein